MLYLESLSLMAVILVNSSFKLEVRANIMNMMIMFEVLVFAMPLSLSGRMRLLGTLQ